MGVYYCEQLILIRHFVSCSLLLLAESYAVALVFQTRSVASRGLFVRVQSCIVTLHTSTAFRTNERKFTIAFREKESSFLVFLQQNESNCSYRGVLVCNQERF
jgi:hypothetical protein